MRNYPVFLFTVFFAANCAMLRLYTRLVSFDAETGLPLPGRLLWFTLFVIICAAALFVAACRYSNAYAEERAQPLRFESRFPTALCTIGAFMLIAIGVLSAVTGRTMLVSVLGEKSIILSAFNVFAGVCVIMFVITARGTRGVPNGLPLLAPACCFAVELVLFYHETGNDPVLALFFTRTLALAFLCLSFVYLAGLSFAVSTPRRCVWLSSLAFVLSVCAVSEGSDVLSILFFAACAILQGGFLAALEHKANSRQSFR